MPPKKVDKPNISELPEPKLAHDELENPTQPVLMEQPQEPKAMPEMTFEGHKLLADATDVLKLQVPSLGRLVHYVKDGKKYLAYVAEDPPTFDDPHPDLNLAIYIFRTAEWRSEVGVRYVNHEALPDQGMGPGRYWTWPAFVPPVPAILPVASVTVDGEEVARTVETTEDHDEA